LVLSRSAAEELWVGLILKPQQISTRQCTNNRRLVKLTSGSLAVFSPVALTDDVKAKVAELGGKLGYIIAPDLEHHIFISEWKKAYPEAKIIGPEGLPEKRAAQKDEKVSNDEFFTVFEEKTKKEKTITAEFDADFDYEYLESHPTKEIVLFYKPDKVLLQADLFFNLPATEQYSRVPEAERAPTGIPNKLWSSIQTTEGDVKWAKRFMWYVQSAKDRPSFNESIQRIDKWDFVTIIPCHGDVMEGDGKARFEKVFAWHLAGHKGGAKA
jgi:hypothetical protein